MNKYTVYILRSTDGRFYKGATSDLQKRLHEHKMGHTRTTRNMTNLEVVYTEECSDWITARKRGKYLKSAAGRRFLKKKLAEVAQLVRASA